MPIKTEFLYQTVEVGKIKKIVIIGQLRTIVNISIANSLPLLSIEVVMSGGYRKGRLLGDTWSWENAQLKLVQLTESLFYTSCWVQVKNLLGLPTPLGVLKTTDQ